ncbi:MAG TPA: type II toxin-antitoxin system HipA family toxin [Solirubrobacterales bacterium]|nr:type II toxin-antitoxin system HipA family toxin [Solirubrobacterales bacterium]
MADTAVDVIVQIGGDDVLAGRLWSHRRPGSESATFSYASDFLERPNAYELDPLLPLFEGQQQTPENKATFGAFADGAPDRWGRRLIHRTERQRARRDEDAERSFGEIDYLLGVRDDLRQGALRFRDPETGTCLADEHSGVPDLLGLPELLGAAERMDRDEADQPTLERLLHGGSSLGGARPKAHVLDQAGRIAIAKFPSPVSDEWDVMRWEAVALKLAGEAGIRVPDWTLHPVGERPVLILDRFDRTAGQRIGYVSAMTMLEASDGDQGSYLDIADAIERHSPSASDDLRQLWRRIAFSVLIRNTDDHLRNHGFLRTSTAGWSLSPAFDLNPDPAPGPKHLSTLIDYDTAVARIDVLMGVAEYFRLNDEGARAILREVFSATTGWRNTARAMGLDRAEIDQMESAFEHEQAKVAREMAAAPSGD